MSTFGLLPIHDIENTVQSTVPIIMGTNTGKLTGVLSLENQLEYKSHIEKPKHSEYSILTTAPVNKKIIKLNSVPGLDNAASLPPQIEKLYLPVTKREHLRRVF